MREKNVSFFFFLVCLLPNGTHDDAVDADEKSNKKKCYKNISKMRQYESYAISSNFFFIILIVALVLLSSRNFIYLDGICNRGISYIFRLK